jgi:hypothetical protein
MLRRALWMSLQGLLVATTLAYLRDMRKAGRDLYFLYYQVRLAAAPQAALLPCSLSLRISSCIVHNQLGAATCLVLQASPGVFHRSKA